MKRVLWTQDQLNGIEQERIYCLPRNVIKRTDSINIQRFYTYAVVIQTLRPEYVRRTVCYSAYLTSIYTYCTSHRDVTGVTTDIL
jgi:hypothetical protein